MLQLVCVTKRVQKKHIKGRCWTLFVTLRFSGNHQKLKKVGPGQNIVQNITPVKPQYVFLQTDCCIHYTKTIRLKLVSCRGADFDFVFLTEPG